MLKLVARVDEVEQEIVAQIGRLISAKLVIISQIDALENERYKILLYMKYVLCKKSWKQVAVEMGYREKWIYQLRKRALSAFSKKWGSEIDKKL